MERLDTSKLVLDNVSMPVLKIIQDVQSLCSEHAAYSDWNKHSYYSDEPRHEHYSDKGK